MPARYFVVIPCESIKYRVGYSYSSDENTVLVLNMVGIKASQTKWNVTALLWFDRKYSYYVNIWIIEHRGYLPVLLKSSLVGYTYDSAKFNTLRMVKDNTWNVQPFLIFYYYFFIIRGLYFRVVQQKPIWQCTGNAMDYTVYICWWRNIKILNIIYIFWLLRTQLRPVRKLVSIGQQLCYTESDWQ